MKNWLAGRKQGKAHTAAVKAARPLELVQSEYNRMCAEIGEREYRRQRLQGEVNALCGEVLKLEQEAEHTRERDQADKLEAERLAAREGK